MTLYHKARKAIRDEDLSGWLFYNFAHRDILADRILAVPHEATNTRPWIYLLLRKQPPVKIVHRIEQSILDHLPGKREVYADREGFKALLKKYAAKGPRVALNYSDKFPQVSHIDHGIVLLLSDLGYRPCPAHDLVPRVLSNLAGAEITHHEKAAQALYKIVYEIWDRIRAHTTAASTPLYEGDVHDWVMELFGKYNLVTDSTLIIGTGKHTALPHYTPSGKGAELVPGNLVQIDIWGRLDIADGIYADISWVGILADEVPPRIGQAFAVLRKARDAAVRYIQQNVKSGNPPSGASVDIYTEQILRQSGFGEYIKHRTGHSIDADVHGSGINIDSGEFPDTRPLGEGSCFSIEPGLYFRDFGMRTEIDVYIHNKKAVISGDTPQESILTL
jgi:Xaa-Pro dipeptidase